MPPPLGSPHLRLLRASRIARLAAGHAARRGHGAIPQLRRRSADGRPRRWSPCRARGERAGRRPSGFTKALVDRALLVRADAALARTARADGRSDRHAQRGHPAAGNPARRIRVLEWGADTDRFRPGAAGAVPFERPRRGRWRSSRARSAPGTARSISSSIKILHAGGCREIGAVLIGDGPELPRVAPRPRRDRRRSCSPARCRTIGMPAALAAADIGVAPFEIGCARAAVARLLLVAAEDLRVHGGRPSGRGALDRTDSARWSRTAARVCSTIRQPGGAGGCPRDADATPAAPSGLAPPRAPARCATTAGRRIAGRSSARISGDAAARRVPR